LSYLGGLGRELPNFLDLNLNPASLENVTICVNSTYTAGNCVVSASSPTGGPIAAGTAFVVPTYTGYGNQALFGSAAANFTNITEYQQHQLELQRDGVRGIQPLVEERSVRLQLHLVAFS
jgi:hypothetical protein